MTPEDVELWDELLHRRRGPHPVPESEADNRSIAKALGWAVGALVGFGLVMLWRLVPVVLGYVQQVMR